MGCSKNTQAPQVSAHDKALGDLRQQIDKVDRSILQLFAERTELAGMVAKRKREHGLAILDPAREREKIRMAAEAAPQELRIQAQLLMELLMESSRLHQHSLLDGTEPKGLATELSNARSATPEFFPREAAVACQGVEGAWSQVAASRFFRRPSISFIDSFEGVFRAVEEGLCEYGVLPIENSTAGSVNRVYDLMREHDFYIVRTTRVQVAHSLVGFASTNPADVTDIYSHEQAINQCSQFLSTTSARVHAVENTAKAAQYVAESGQKTAAALCAAECADLYGLDVLLPYVQNTDNNHTRFACIARTPQVFAGADRTSLMIVANHEPGSLHRLLARMNALDVNLLKLESRPISGRDFEFMFYFDLECPAAEPRLSTLLATLPSACQEIRWLGTYSEVVL